MSLSIAAMSLDPAGIGEGFLKFSASFIQASIRRVVVRDGRLFSERPDSVRVDKVVRLLDPPIEGGPVVEL